MDKFRLETYTSLYSGRGDAFDHVNSDLLAVSVIQDTLAMLPEDFKDYSMYIDTEKNKLVRSLEIDRNNAVMCIILLGNNIEWIKKNSNSIKNLLQIRVIVDKELAVLLENILSVVPEIELVVMDKDSDKNSMEGK